eukprot:3414907-Pleurochrysis_carterae.AAC.1
MSFATTTRRVWRLGCARARCDSRGKTTRRVSQAERCIEAAVAAATAAVCDGRILGLLHLLFREQEREVEPAQRSARAVANTRRLEEAREEAGCINQLRDTSRVLFQHYSYRADPTLRLASYSHLLLVRSTKT